MPVRSSVCTYTPSSGSKYSPNSLSIGHYKQLTTNSSTAIKPSSYSTGIGSISRYSLSSSSSSYSPSSFNGSYSSLSSTSSYTPSGHYRPLSTSNASFTSSRPTTASTYSRYSSASSTGSTSSSLSSTTSFSDKGDVLSGGYSSISNHSYQPSSLNRRLSYTSHAEALPPGVPCGLTNLGNTCYLNATIQSLYSIDSFRNLILRAPQDKTLTSEISDLFKKMKASTSPVSPSSFKHSFSRYQTKFSGYGQQDAQEFLRYLINGLHEEWNLASKKPRSSVPPKAPKTAEEAWDQYKNIVDDSPLVDIVVGQLCSTIICSICQNKSYCWDPFWDLSLPLVRGRHKCKLSSVIDDFTAKETLDSDERPICSNCKKATRSTKQISLHRMPKLIILHLKKFTNDGYKMTSPEIEIDDKLNFNDTPYMLTACISHHGHSSSSGHYTSHCKYSSRWFHFNDERVKEVTSLDSSKLADAYVLFYTQNFSSDSRSRSKL